MLALIVVKALARAREGRLYRLLDGTLYPVYRGSTCASCAYGRVGEVSVIGIVLLVASIWFESGIIAHDPYWGPALTFKDTTITFTLIGYAFISALLRYG